MFENMHWSYSKLIPAETVPLGPSTSVQWLETWQRPRSYDFSLLLHPVISSPENISKGWIFKLSNVWEKTNKLNSPTKLPNSAVVHR